MYPQLSVILAVHRLRERAVGSLRALLEQSRIAEMEIILFDLHDSAPPLPGSEHPSVRLIRLAPDAVFSKLRAEGVRLARAPIVAFAEEHCRVRPGWAEAIIRAHAAPVAAVGAEIHNGNSDSRLSRIIAVMNYNEWLPPAPRGEFNMLPGHNSSFKREVLLSYGAELETLLRAEVALYLRLHRDGHRLLLEPDAKFEHINETRLRSIASGYFLWHRSYGPIRARVFNWSLARRWFYIVATPAIPLYYVVRLAGVLLRKRPELLKEAFLGLPQIVFAQSASALGQAVGLLFGEGDAERRFTDYELNEPRQWNERAA